MCQLEFVSVYVILRSVFLSLSGKPKTEAQLKKDAKNREKLEKFQKKKEMEEKKKQEKKVAPPKEV